MPRKYPGISTSDREVLRGKPGPRAKSPEPEEAPPHGRIPELGYSEGSVLVFMNACSKALMDGAIDEKRNESLQGNARVALNAIKSRDDKAKIANLEQMLKDAQRVANDGLKREAEDRHHVTRTAETGPAADAGDKADGPD
jgi:hypothetical protein